VEPVARLANSGALHFRMDGLMPAYLRARKDRGSKRQEKLIAYTSRAAEDAEVLAGSVIREALRKAKVTPGADVLVILSPDLALLPLRLATPAGCGVPLGQAYQLRYADSMASAVAATNRAASYASRAPTANVMAGD